jgi:hypothetical protein
MLWMEITTAVGGQKLNNLTSSKLLNAVVKLLERKVRPPPLLI